MVVKYIINGDSVKSRKLLPKKLAWALRHSSPEIVTSTFLGFIVSPRLTLTLIVSCFQIYNIGDVRKGVIRYDPNNGCEGDYIDVCTVVLLVQNKAFVLGSETIRADWFVNVVCCSAMSSFLAVKRVFAFALLCGFFVWVQRLPINHSICWKVPFSRARLPDWTNFKQLTDLKLYISCWNVLVTDSMGGIRLKRSLTDLLQYCLLTGWEWWDVLMAAHLGTPAG